MVQKRTEKKAFIKTRRAEWKNKAKKYFEANKAEELRLINEKRVARNNGNFFVAPAAKVAFVIRTKGINKIRPQVKKILQLFRLRQLNNGVFIKINKATLNMLNRVAPYVTFGYPSRKVIAELIYSRGFGKVNRARIPLSDNCFIEQNLGKAGITCVEDLIEEIHKVGANFKEA